MPSPAPVSEGATYGIATRPFHHHYLGQDPLPPLSHARYLATVFSFHLGPLYHFFREDQLNEALSTVYDKTVTDSETPVLWRVQLLLVVAMARLILARGPSELGPPGVAAFLEAMRLLPDIKALYTNQILSIGILSLIALYLQSADMRTAAHVYVSPNFFRPFPEQRVLILLCRLVKHKDLLCPLVFIEKRRREFLNVKSASIAAGCGGQCISSILSCLSTWAALYPFRIRTLTSHYRSLKMTTMPVCPSECTSNLRA